MGASTNAAIRVQDDWVNVEWLEIRGGSGSTARGVQVDTIIAGSKTVLRNLLIHDMPGQGIRLDDPDVDIDIYNNIIYEVAVGIRPTLAIANARVLNNTIYRCNDIAFGEHTGINGPSGANITLRNNIVHSNVGGDIKLPGVDAASSNNLASDGTGTTHSPAGGGIDSVPLASMNFVNTTVGSEDLHITALSAAEDVAADLSGIFNFDIDGGARQTPWDIGADDILATTAVELVSITARGLDGAVALRWETGSELNNLGFQLYRAESEGGPLRADHLVGDTGSGLFAGGSKL